MAKIIHISDPHMVPAGERVITLDPYERLTQVLDEVNARHADADLCVVTGDLTDRGDVASYRRLAERLQVLSVPCHLILGNHDNRHAFREVFPSADLDDGGFVQSTVDIGDDLRLVLLDTLDNARPDTGRLCEKRLGWLSRRLEKAGERRVLLFMHHPPLTIGIRWFDNMMLENPDAFERVMRLHPNVAHVAFGHVHLTTAGSWGGVSFSCNAGTCHHIALGFDGESVEFVEAPPVFDVILAGGEDVVVHHTGPHRHPIAREYATADGKGRFELTAPTAAGPGERDSTGAGS